jgi:hypothetical protein
MESTMSRLLAATLGLGLLAAAGTAGAAPVRPVAGDAPHGTAAPNQIVPAQYNPYYRPHYAPPRHWHHHRHWRPYAHWHHHPHAYAPPHPVYRPYAYQYGWR